MKSRQSSQLLWFLSITLVVICGSMLMASDRTSCGDKREVYVRWLPARDEQSRTMNLQRLSSEIKRCPNSNIYVLTARLSFNGKYSNAITFSRHNKRVGEIIESQESGNPWRSWSNVTDEAIHRVAAQGGGFDDLIKYGAKNRPCCG